MEIESFFAVTCEMLQERGNKGSLLKMEIESQRVLNV